MQGFLSAREKGISPLIAAVLLIAFTMTIAAILATWAQTFGEERLGEAGERGEEVVECARLSLDLESASWVENEERVEDAIVWNRGPNPTTSIRFVIYEGGVPNTFEDDDISRADNGEDDDIILDSGDFKRLEVETAGISDPDRIEVHAQAGRCPEAQPLDTCNYELAEGDFVC